MKNKILLISLILTLLLSNTSYASSTNNLVINGKILNIDVEQEFNEYYFAKSLGFKDIIYSMYQVYLTDGQIFSFARDNEVYAITMGESRALSGLAKRLTDINVMTYVHTVNDIDLINKYRNLGVVGFYTDKLY